jgi:prepilin-type N-terminal cleavage/methylation domain-containing protein/prepilin-type processing-associated H-X9-DG protein
MAVLPFHFCKRKSFCPAFSLVELLVVIAIIAVLAALILPAMARSKASAKRVQCLGQLLQWGKALQIYAGDNENIIPRRGQGVRPLTQLDRPEDWFNALAPDLNQQAFGDYVAQAGTNANSPPPLYVCPEAQPVDGRCFLTYAMNMYLSPWSRPDPHHLTQISVPTSVVFLQDGGIGYSSAFPAVAEYSPQARHRGTANLVFVDGHAASFKGDDIGCNTGKIKLADVVWDFDPNAASSP